MKNNLDEAKWLIANLPIRLFGDPILNKRCSVVTKKEIQNGQAKKWADELVSFLKQYRQKTGAGRGLAANQIGIPKRMVLVWLDDGPNIYINPKVISSEGKGLYPESCISAASLIMGDVVRPWRASFGYTSLDGQKKSLKADQMHTRLLLHEIDHLNGKICTDKYISGTTRLVGGANEVLRPKIKKIK